MITTFAVPQLTSADAANLGTKTYLVFAGCMACVVVFVYFSMPETRGRTFAEVDEMYDAGIPHVEVAQIPDFDNCQADDYC